MLIIFLSLLHFLIQVLALLFVFKVGDELAYGIHNLGLGEVIFLEDALQLIEEKGKNLDQKM